MGHDSCLHHIDLAVQGSGCVAEMAASHKEAKYATLQTHYDFQPIAVETLGPINESATSFLYDLGRRISLVSGEDREPQFLYQCISVAIQRFNAVLLHDGFCLSTTRISAAPDFNFLH